MRIPTRSMACNLRWTRSGTVWADWILTGLPYGLRPTKDKHIVRSLAPGPHPRASWRVVAPRRLLRSRPGRGGGEDARRRRPGRLPGVGR